MRIIFALSASLWCWLVSRVIAFGPNSKSFCWHPNMHADTWYRLTELPLKITPAIFTYIPIYIAIASISTLYVDNDIIHILSVIFLVSEHTFVPIFVAHIHSDVGLCLWSVVNIISNIFLIYYVAIIWVTIPLLVKITIHTWFLIIESYIILWNIEIKKYAPVYEKRKSRVITV